MVIHSERATEWWEENTENVAETANYPVVGNIRAPIPPGKYFSSAQAIGYAIINCTSMT